MHDGKAFLRVKYASPLPMYNWQEGMSRKEINARFLSLEEGAPPLKLRLDFLLAWE